MRMTISGPPGSGKTTVCNILSKRLKLNAVVFGRIFREYAAEHKLSLSELGRIAENDPSIDKAIDSRILEIARANDSIILESRLSAYMLSRNGICAFKVYLDADPAVRMSRIGDRDNESTEQATAETLDREASESKRYMQYYGIDINDKSVYDLIVSTDDMTPEEVADKIVSAMERFKC